MKIVQIPPFDYHPRTRVVFGPGSLARLGRLVAELGGRRVLLVTDSGLRDVGYESRATTLLREADLEPIVFADVRPSPTTEDVERGTAFARAEQVDFIVGLGGGSCQDCAKGINFLLTNGGRMEDYWGSEKAKHPLLPLIAVPTTAGTGSEAQSYAVISQAVTHVKMACGDKKAAPRVAILDPELTLTMPAAVTAVTGIDAISHAVESHVTRQRTPVSAEFSRRAWRLLHAAFPQVLATPKDLSARGAMLLGAHYAGTAIENSMLGATHALANPLSARFGLTHGIVIGILLPHVIRYNAPVCGALYAELEADAGWPKSESPGIALAGWIEKQVAIAGSPTSLKACELIRTDEMLHELAADAATQWTGRANPRLCAPSDFASLYRFAGF